MLNKYEINGDKVTIFIRYKGEQFETIIDLIDLTRAKEFPTRWRAVRSPNAPGYYAVGSVSKKQSLELGGQRTFQLHRWIMNTPKHLHVDHINHDTLNNRRENLREVTVAQNAQNRVGPMRNNKSSKVLGVTWHKRDRYWQAKIVLNKKPMYLGSFKNKLDAELAVKKARKEFMPFSQEAM